MDLDTIIGEVKDRGFDYLPNARITRWVNQVYLNLCESERWPFLEADSTGSSPPLTISDLGAVDSVIDATNNRILTWVDRRTLLDADTDLTTTGTPVCWYQESQTVLKVYPANTAITLNVHYFKVPSELSAGGDEPVIPARWQELLIDGTVVRPIRTPTSSTSPPPSSSSTTISWSRCGTPCSATGAIPTPSIRRTAPTRAATSSNADPDPLPLRSAQG